jgi:hypothetical protein
MKWYEIWDLIFYATWYDEWLLTIDDWWKMKYIWLCMIRWEIHDDE